MSSISLFTLSHSAVLELLELDLSPIGVNEIHYFCNYNNTSGTDVSLGGQTYIAFPFETAGWEKASGGTLPAPTITLSNIFSDISSLILQHDGLRGAKVTRKKILAKNIDGMPGANPLAIESLDIYFVSRYAENEIYVIFTLTHPLNKENLKLPRRRVVSLLT